MIALLIGLAGLSILLIGSLRMRGQARTRSGNDDGGYVDFSGFDGGSHGGFDGGGHGGDCGGGDGGGCH